MSQWSDGYVVDIPYISGFYREVSPTWLSWAATLNGYSSPGNRKIRYADLGCGLGHGTALLAATHPDSEFFGFDFHPGQIASAQRFVRDACLSNIHFYERSFEDLLNCDDQLPMFDYVILHGIWSWMTADNQRYILEFIRRHLLPGGYVYVSYNCSAGWANFGPAQSFMKAYSASVQGSSAERARMALRFMDSLSEGGSRYFKANPGASAQLQALKKNNEQYVAHELLNGEWLPLDHMTVRSQFASVKCDYVCSATIADNIEETTIPSSVRDALKSLTDPALREAARDIACGQSFRRDVYARGADRLTAAESKSALAEQRLVALKIPADGRIVTTTPLGQVSGQPDLYEPMLAELGARPELTMGELSSIPQLRARGSGEILQAAAILTHAGVIHPRGPEGATPTAQAFNETAIRYLMRGREIPYVAIARAGTGTGLSFLEIALLVTFRDDDALEGSDLVNAVWLKYQKTGRMPLRDGVLIDNPIEAQKLIAERLPKSFVDERKGFYKRCGLLSPDT